MLISRRELMAMAVAAGSGSPLRAAPGFEKDLSLSLIPAPDDPRKRVEFRDVLQQWRTDSRARLHYDDAPYRKPEFAWVPSCFVCCFLMIWDETVYSPVLGRFTMDAFLDHGQR